MRKLRWWLGSRVVILGTFIMPKDKAAALVETLIAGTKAIEAKGRLNAAQKELRTKHVSELGAQEIYDTLVERRAITHLN